MQTCNIAIIVAVAVFTLTEMCSDTTAQFQRPKSWAFVNTNWMLKLGPSL